MNMRIHASIHMPQVEQLRQGNTEQMKKVGAEIVKLQKSNQLKREVVFQTRMLCTLSHAQKCKRSVNLRQYN